MPRIETDDDVIDGDLPGQPDAGGAAPAPDADGDAPAEQPQGDEGDGTPAVPDAPAPEADDGGGEVFVVIGDEQPTPEDDEHAAPQWVRDLRRERRELIRKQRELEAENARLKGGATHAPALDPGPKPTLAGCDYDEEKFATALDAWHGKKAAADRQREQAEAADARARQAWQERLAVYQRAGRELKVRDFEDAEAAAQDVLSVTQQGVILSGAENPALVVYALGKTPKKAAELAAIQDPVKFAFAVAKLETQLKVTTKRAAPPPEKTVKPGGAGAAAVGNTLERLREEAARTGDMTKVLAYKRQMRDKEKQRA